MVPDKINWNDARCTTTIFWKNRLPGEYHVRGGICFPMSYIRYDGIKDINGYAVIGGYNVRSNCIEIFEQKSFMVVENIYEDNKIKYEGIAQWIERCWANYFANCYFWSQNEVLVQKYKLEIIRSKIIRTEPQFIHIDFDIENALHTIWRYVKVGAKAIKLGDKKGGDDKEDKKKEKDEKVTLYNDLVSIKQGDTKITPSVHALACMIMGLEKYPWRNPFNEKINEY
jgi:hypothetical protein